MKWALYGIIVASFTVAGLMDIMDRSAVAEAWSRWGSPCRRRAGAG